MFYLLLFWVSLCWLSWRQRDYWGAGKMAVYVESCCTQEIELKMIKNLEAAKVLQNMALPVQDILSILSS